MIPTVSARARSDGLGAVEVPAAWSFVRTGVGAPRRLTTPRPVPVTRMALFLLVVFLTACSVRTQKRTFVPRTETQTLDRRSPFLKAHMLDGRTYILSEWRLSAASDSVSGRGKLLDVNREVIGEGQFVVPVDSVALFETNRVQTSPAVAAMTLVTAASAALTVYCLTNPKACFGSCPTFYVWDGEEFLLQAEGFSASVAPALEARDIDALYRARPQQRDFEIRMANEALETHVVRSVRLLAVPRPLGGRVFAATDGTFYQAHEIIEPAAATGPEGDCRGLLRAFDGIERYSRTDSTDLATKEVIDLEFQVEPGGRFGLVIGARQSLLSTFLFYQALAYMGRSAGQWFAALERGDRAIHERLRAPGRLLGGIEVLLEDGEGGWISAGQINETGPLATDVRVVPLPELKQGAVKLRLRLTRGHWRLDFVALARLGDRIEPLPLQPVRVRRLGVVDEQARLRLLDSTQVLTTLPGDQVSLLYRLPEDFERYELFLESRGYYIEWMRQEWLKEENRARAALFFIDPKGTLRALAPEFKRIEAEMEQAFWRSRYGSR